jgi:membrane-associated phospholipid phosphatase
VDPGSQNRAASLAGEYRSPWIRASLYSVATGVSLTRVLGQQHFPGDVLAGSAAGWLVGHYVFRAHHRHHADASR